MSGSAGSVFLEHVHDSQKVNLFCTLRVYGPFYLMEMTITSIVYLDMLQQFLIPQLDEDDQEGRIHSLPWKSVQVPHNLFLRSVDS
jgi:hypothetical protein